jgi:hypothetical protein
MINTCSPNKGLLRTVVILYYHRKRQAALLSQIYSHETDCKENSLNGLQQSMHCCTVSSGYSATFFTASKQRNSNSVQGIFMYEKFNRFACTGKASIVGAVSSDETAIVSSQFICQGQGWWHDKDAKSCTSCCSVYKIQICTEQSDVQYTNNSCTDTVLLTSTILWQPG